MLSVTSASLGLFVVFVVVAVAVAGRGVCGDRGVYGVRGVCGDRKSIKEENTFMELSSKKWK